jgi:hypothetical protein
MWRLPVLVSNVPFMTGHMAFGLLKHPFQFGAVHSITYQPESTVGPFSAVESNWPSAVGGGFPGRQIASVNQILTLEGASG